MDIYDLMREVESSNIRCHYIILPNDFTEDGRSKLSTDSDKRIFDLLQRLCSATILYRSRRDKKNPKQECRVPDSVQVNSFQEDDWRLLKELDWSKFPDALKAYALDVIWLIHHEPDAARNAEEAYFALYHSTFDEDNWVECVDYIYRAVELASKLGDLDRRQAYLKVVYNDVLKIDGMDPSFLSFELIKLLIDQKYDCDYRSLLPVADHLIARKINTMIRDPVIEASYQLKADIYQKLGDRKSADKVYVNYADELLSSSKEILSEKSDGIQDDSRWFAAELDVKKAIGYYQDHGASDKAVEGQKVLAAIQQVSVKHIKSHTFKFDVTSEHKQFSNRYSAHTIHELLFDIVFDIGFQNVADLREKVLRHSPMIDHFNIQVCGNDGQTECMLPGLNPRDENIVILHMYYRARQDESIIGDTYIKWFIQELRQKGLQESDLKCIFLGNPIIPEGQEDDVMHGVFLGLTGHMSDALDKLAPKAENIIRYIAEMCGDLTGYYDVKNQIQKKKVLGEVFKGKNLNECLDENILFTFNGLLQQKAGSNIRNRIAHGLTKKKECNAGDCLYFVAMMLKLCGLFSSDFYDEYKRRHQSDTGVGNGEILAKNRRA